MSLVKIDQKRKRVEIKEFEIENEIVLNFFDRIPADQRDETLFKALYMGTLALMEDRLSSFLAKTSNDLGVQLESLKMIFDMKKELFFKSSIKGILAEDSIQQYLIEFFKDQNMKDVAYLTGNVAGMLPKNKTGDIICAVNGEQDLKIVIECKFDKSIRLGEIENKDIFTRKTDTVWSQLIEAQANRDGKASIIVLDYSLVDALVLKKVQNVRFIPSVGFVAIIDTQKGDFSNLAIAYMLARDIAVNAKPVEFDKDLLAILINRTIKDLGDIQSIKQLVLDNVENNKKILGQLEKSMLSVRFGQQYLTRFLKTGVLSRQDLLEFYSGEEVNNVYKPIEKEIKDI